MALANDKSKAGNATSPGGASSSLTGKSTASGTVESESALDSQDKD
jgi:hypothetical protein